MKDEPAIFSLSGEAYELLRERILRGEMTIGKVISRRKIAHELGMSLIPVSEALHRLEHEGLLESRPRAGTRVKVPTEQDVRGHYIVREALEVQAAKLFAEVATSTERTELQRLAFRIDTLAAQTDVDVFRYLTLHEKLHQFIAKGAHCRPLYEAIEKTQVLSSTWLCAPKPAIKGAVYTHQDLVQAITQKTAEAAGKAMQDHVQLALDNTLKRLESYFQIAKSNDVTYARGRHKMNATA
ncbi:MAG: GntR family transcriptional regulator [Blastocatellia bacterium]|nr:GntR family transcriptional regulator [Blastocatellia bacterium]